MFLTMKAIKRLPLNVKTLLKYLGLLIDENLSWKTHIHSVTNKISKTIRLIARLRHIYCSHLHPPKYLSVTNYTLSNLLTLFKGGNACKTFLDQILVLQKRTLRLICMYC